MILLMSDTYGISCKLAKAIVRRMTTQLLKRDQSAMYDEGLVVQYLKICLQI